MVAQEKNGYFIVKVRKHSQSGFKNYLTHRFVRECFNGVIPDGKVIDHINNDRGIIDYVIYN